MSSRKFCAMLLLGIMLFSAMVCAGGCGGGGGSSDPQPTPTTPTPPDPTPTPTPTPEPEPEQEQDPTPTPIPVPTVSVDVALSEVEYAVSNIAVTYADGDNPRYVTRNMVLPTSTEGAEGINIFWTSSNPSVISSYGTVNRQTGDTEVTLTVTATNESATASRNFNVTVIRQRSRTVEQAKTEILLNGITEIRTMNVSNDEFRVMYSTSRDRITDIDGQYTDIDIGNADDALDAVWSLHGILGIDDPYEELEPSVITSDPYGAEYTFSQVYNGVRVFGRNMTVSANDAGEGDFIASNILPTSKLASSNLNFAYTKEQAENAAKTHYTGNVDVQGGMTEQVIFSLYDYVNNPVPAYYVNVYGNDDNGAELDENVYVSAIDGSVIFTSTNLHNADVLETRTADDELSNITDVQRTFPVVREVWINGTWYVMRDPETRVVLYNKYAGINGILIGNRVSFGQHDEQQVSAYANMIDVMKWWRASFDRNSLDDSGMTVKVVTHKPGGTDNAYWNGSIIAIYDAFSDQRSRAAAVDVMAHESTHGVISYRIGRDFTNNYSCNINRTTGEGPAAGAINEGYADIFGCLMTGQWKHSLNVHADGAYERNIANPADAASLQNSKGFGNAPRTLSECYTGAGDHGGVHINSSLVSYPAYLMYDRYGFSMSDLASLWYKSMRMGYNAESGLKDVRICVLRAARKLGMSAEQKDRIRMAFDDVGIGEVTGNIHGLVTDRETIQPIQGATVILSKDNGTGANTAFETGINGVYSLDVEYGTYTVSVSKNDYIELKASREIEEGDEIEMNVALVKQGKGNISGTVRDAVTGDYLSGVTVRLREGWSIADQNAATYTQQTNSNGYYSMTSVDAGYYTIEASLPEYAVTTTETTITPNVNRVDDLLLSPITSRDVYRVTLQWTENPRDLDSHLIGPMPNRSSSFHVYYSNKQAYYNGGYVAQLDHDDTQGNGFETITFQMRYGDTFKYYVHWYAGTGTWAGSNAVVNLYKGTRLIATFSVPNVNQDGNTAGRYWHVFNLTNGLDPVVQRSSSITTTAPTLGN